MTENSVKEFLRDQLIEKIEQLTVFNEIAFTVASTRELADILTTVVGQVYRLIQFDYAEITLSSVGHEPRRYVYTETRQPQARVEVNPDLSGTAIADILRNGKPRLVRDTATGQEYRDDVVLLERGMRSALFLPIKSGDIVSGCLIIASTQPERFSIIHEHTLENICCQIASAVRQACLFSELQATRDHLVRLIENAGEAISAVDRELKINTWNRRSDEIFGKDRLQALTSKLTYEHSQEDETSLEELFQEAMTSGQVQRVIARKSHEDSGLLDLDISVSPIADNNGQVIGALSVTRDVTDNRLLQDQLLQTKKLATMGELISGITHELNNKLAPILGYAQLIHRRIGEQDPRLSSMFARIEEAAASAKKVIESLLSFARPQKTRLDYVQINEVINTTLELVHFQLEKEDIVLRLEAESSLPHTIADGHQLSQVLLNLVNNAIHAMRGRDYKVITIRTQQVEDQIRIQVCDTGPGIPPHLMERIFDPFFSTKQTGEGTGLGLSVSFGIIQAHNGSIRAENLPDAGACFTVDLPIVSRPVKNNVPKKIETEEEAAPPSHILVVDDDQFLRELIRDILKRENEILTADSGYEAIQHVKMRMFDAIILDLRMPGMNGMDFFAWLKREHPEMADRVIFITGDTFDNKTDKFLHSSGRPWLAKPFQITDLKRILSQVLKATVEKASV